MTNSNPRVAVIGVTDTDGTWPAQWLSASGSPPPSHVVVVDDRITADEACRLASRGTGMVWRGDFQNARQLLTAMDRRMAGSCESTSSPAETFRALRRDQARRARTLGMLLVPLEPGPVVPLRRAPDIRQACTEVHGSVDAPAVISLRELLGMIGAHEWRKGGVPIPALGARIHPHYGVFSPIRGEYVDLVAETPLPSRDLAFDIGTGTGVLAAVLAQRGVKHVVATDNDPRAVMCAQENVQRLGLADRVEIRLTDLFPRGRAALVVCNPPWIPARAHSVLDRAVYDPGSRMLRAFLDRLVKHLRPQGEAWLILSDLAEHLGLRTRAELLAAIEKSGLRVLGRSDARADHPRVADRADPLHAARAAEVTSLWRLTVR
jgi:predicted O-methyltransferase YrrM